MTWTHEQSLVHVQEIQNFYTLLISQDLSYCTGSNFRTLENKHKALVFKELRKVWESYDDPDLPWKKGEFDESNTLLLDDTPYKALLNPVS